MKREEQDKKYQWDLSMYIKDEKMLNDEFEWLKNNYPKFKEYYGKFADEKTLLDYFKFSDEFEIREDRLASYLYHSLDQDTSNTKFLALTSKFSYLANDISKTCAFITPQLLALDEEYLKKLLNKQEFFEYYRTLESILRNKSHQISEHDSELISKMGLFLGGASEIFGALTTGEMNFDDVTVDGQAFKVDEANYSKLMNNKNRETRRLALKSLMSAYGGKIKTIASMYLNSVEESIFFSKLANFNSVREEALFNEEVDKSVYERLIKQINENLPILHSIMEKRRKALNLDKIAYYDAMVSFDTDKQISIEEAQELVKNATKPLGDEYQKLVSRKFEEKCIDYLPNDNKETGAYSSGVYDCPSVILMNYVGDLKSVYTLAHEMGHTMHSEFSNRNQPFATSQYKIFVAEVASTVNEMLLYNYLVKDADKELKKALVFDLCDEFRSTVFRQTMFSEFEDFAHTTLENKTPLTYEDLNKYYYDLNKKYYGEVVELPEELKFEWARIPHFYRPFYVYKYATGFISAVCIVKKILTEKDYYKQYINFLKSGSSKPVIDLLRDIDVDLATDKPYKLAFGYLKEQLELV